MKTSPWVAMAVISPTVFIGPLLARSPQASPGITVQIYNWASVATQILAAAEGDATRIFREAGVAPSRLNCPLSILEAQANPICIEACPASRLAVRIISEIAANLANTSVGVALTEGGIYATIFYPRVNKYAQEGIASHSQILGHAIAHEMGHLLLGPAPHTRFGIMHGEWTAADLQGMAMGAFHFSPQQSALLRQTAMQRKRGQKCPQSPGAELKIKPPLEVRVQVYNGAHVSSRDLLRAEERAGRVFKQANILVVWTAGSMLKDPSPDAAHEQWIPGDLQLRIWTRSLAQPSMIDSDALGFCTSIEGGQAVVLFDAIRSLVGSRFSNPANLLGLAMAHEMGHILLRSVNHSTVGIMRARWLPNDLHDAETGSLVFTREQADSMQNEVRRRVGIRIAPYTFTQSQSQQPPTGR